HLLPYTTLFRSALNRENEIFNPSHYLSISSPQAIYVRLENEICFRIASFLIAVKNCPIWIPEGFSPNGDGINDFFEISNLLNIFLDHEMLIYSREGNLIFRGNNHTGFWAGKANEGLIFQGPVPVGLYYYVLNLNDPEYPKPYIGWVYLNK